MPTIDPQLNQIVWWIVLGAFIGWLLWVLIDRLVWRDGASAAAIDQEQHAGVVAELGSARREENLLRAELVREQEETQRLVGITKDLRDKLNGQEQIVANLEAALDAARYSSPGPGAALAKENLSAPGTLPPNTSLGPSTGNHADRPTQRDDVRHVADKTDEASSVDGEQALRDLLAESAFTEDLDDLLGADEDLFGAPTEILTRTSDLSDKRADLNSDPFATSTQIRYTRPASASAANADGQASNGPMSDAELDRLLDMDTGKLLAQKAQEASPDIDDSADSNLDVHTLTMLERLRDEQEPDRPATEPADRTEQDSSLISRLRGAFGRKPSDGGS